MAVHMCGGTDCGSTDCGSTDCGSTDCGSTVYMCIGGVEVITDDN